MAEQNPENPTNNAAPAAAPAAAAPASSLPSVPSSWPGAFGVYKYSKEAVKVNVTTLIVVWLIIGIPSVILEHVLKNPGSGIAYLLDSLASAAFALIFIASVRRQKLSIGDALSKAVTFWLKMIVLNLLVGISLVVSFLLLIVPFFFVAPRVALASYFLVDKNLGIMEAYKASWAATKGHSGKVWGIFGANILMALLMITVIGIPFSIYFLIMYSAAIAILYEFLNKSRPAAPAQPAAPAVPTITPPTI